MLSYLSRQLQIKKKLLVKSAYQVFVASILQLCVVSDIGAVVKVVDSHLCGWSSIPSKGCSLLVARAYHCDSWVSLLDG